MRKAILILLVGLFWSSVGFAENINIKLDCSFGVEGNYFIEVKGNKVFVNGYENTLELTDAFLHINRVSSGYQFLINRYTLKATLRITNDHQGTCKKVSKKQF